ncbi:calmodulin-binding transcription activator 4 isoform X1 [Helianthus annuus]|uniref:calmodulin-binding transcription activator 4 isoform X1 n=1 Tax=Helianthus annuus TaxID=4232 RepID=UPI000B8F71E8|nr:calmodulin-binding transcription activator 4 isoform X1 [Helianthus annuus]
MMMSGYNIKDLIQEAQFRWLRPGEVLFILENYEETQLNHEPPQKPPSGSLFLFNKRVLRFFRKDGHSWRKKKDGKNVGEAHERLKVGNVEALNCYYAHGEENPNFQRRSYWMLDTAMEHIVLVHYRDITIGKHSAGPISSLTLGSSNIIQSSHSYTTQLISPSASEFDEPYTSLSAGPTSIEASQSVLTTSHRPNLIERIEETDPSPDLQINQALRRLEEQLSLDGLKDVGICYDDNDVGLTINEQSYSGSEGLHYGSDDYVSLQYPALDKAEDQLNTLDNCTTDHAILHQYQQPPMGEFTLPSQQTLIWKDILKYDENAADDGSLENYVYPSDQNEVLLPQSQGDIMEDQVKHHSGDTGASNDSSIFLSQELEDSTFPGYIPPKNMFQSDADLYSTLFDQGQIETPLTSDSSLTIAQVQKFSIREISPEWGYVTEPTKVLIIGAFTCDSSNNEWICMFGDTEVPVKIIQEGVISCHAPPHPPGKVAMCITSGNREACSEVREFEYLDKPSMQVRTNFSENELKRSPEELLLLVRFVQMLLSDKIGQNGKSTGMESDVLTSSMAGEDSWAQIIESLLNGSLESWKTIDWLLEEVLKDKLQTWVWLKMQEKEDLPVLSKREQGIIHMISGLGFVWALAPILKSGVGINFRDVNGWTALHWAARFGREKMIAELLASGAYAGAVTDPSQQDPSGKTAASIAATYGHNGLAGYLAEVALTTHLSSLTLKESELSKCCADVEAERTVNSISNPNFVNTDRLSFKETMAAVRNAAQAASRIQAAFRAHSFRKRKQQQEAAAAASGYDEYGICESDIEGLSAASKVIFGNARDHNAALCIQKKYRGWKGRKDYLAFRKKVVKIQAHVRGHQARKNYEIICWAVGIVEKIVLRWHRKGVGLRGFHLDCVDESENEEDIMKIFRKQKVDVALSEAVSRVVSMVNSSPARQQYRRMLQKYQQAKAERGGLEMEMESGK